MIFSNSRKRSNRRPLQPRLWVLSIGMALLLLNPTPARAERVATIKLPPASLAAWYKPRNKRQVWLHTMFRIGQATGAVALYANTNDRERLLKWAEILSEKYATLTKMVPEWREEVDNEAAKTLLTAARAGKVPEVNKSLKKLRATCKSCHGSYRIGTVALYRSADFSKVPVAIPGSPEKMDYERSMKTMRRQLTALKIARADENLPVARQQAGGLKKSLMGLGVSCISCHRDTEPRKRILGTQTFQTLDALIAALQQPHDAQKSGRLLGEVGFTVCGRCHAIHRNAAEIRTLLQEAQESEP